MDKKHLTIIYETTMAFLSIIVAVILVLDYSIKLSQGMHLSEGIPIGNALWLSFVTITTVGYGDISPSTTSGKFIAGFLMITGIGFLSMLTANFS